MPANLEATASKSAEASRLTGEAAVAPSAKKAVMARSIERFRRRDTSPSCPRLQQAGGEIKDCAPEVSKTVGVGDQHSGII